MHKTFFFMLFALFGLAGLVAEAHAQADYKIVTGPERGTYIQIGQDLAKWVADPIGMDLDVLASKGSAENVQRMRYEPGVKFALVQSADRLANALTRAGLRAQFPQASEREIFLRLAARRLGWDVVLTVYPDASAYAELHGR